MDLSSSRTVRMSTLMFFFWGAIITVEGFMVPYLTSVGFSERRTGVIMAALFIISVFSTPVWGYVADRTDRHKHIIIIALVNVKGTSTSYPDGYVYAYEAYISPCIKSKYSISIVSRI